MKGVGGRKTSPVVKRALYGWGGSLLAMGATFVLLGFALEENGSSTNTGNTHVFRNIGIGSAVAGGAMIGIGLALP